LILTGRKPVNEVIVSLFDYSGVWSKPYRDAGYAVMQIDLQLGQDIRTAKMPLLRPRGIIAQPPCDHFANAGARWFEEKDSDGRTMQGMELVYHALTWVYTLKPQWWVLENPPGRIHKLIPELGDPVYKFSPHEFGEEYRKQTWLWGEFNKELEKSPVEYQGARPGQPDEWYSRVGGRNGLAGKNYRSRTSEKFAMAFFKANP
jgi:site-specific DNA-cytosine methylase